MCVLPLIPPAQNNLPPKLPLNLPLKVTGHISDAKPTELILWEQEREKEKLARMYEWSRFYDPTSVSYYYYNNSTHVTVYEEPEDYVEPPNAAVFGMIMSDELRSALVIQGNRPEKRQRDREQRENRESRETENRENRDREQRQRRTPLCLLSYDYI